jgi:hypothetical protein
MRELCIDARAGRKTQLQKRSQTWTEGQPEVHPRVTLTRPTRDWPHLCVPFMTASHGPEMPRTEMDAGAMCKRLHHLRPERDMDGMSGAMAWSGPISSAGQSVAERAGEKFARSSVGYGSRVSVMCDGDLPTCRIMLRNRNHSERDTWGVRWWVE